MAKLMSDPGWVGMDNAARRVIGGRGDMSREQTRFASFFAEMGLERGKERSGARNVSNREHEAERVRLREKDRRLAADRLGLAEKAKEAEELKARAIDRMHKLRELLIAGRRIRTYAQTVPVGRRSPGLVMANAAAGHLAAATQGAAQDDAWIAAAIAFRSDNGVRAGR